MCVCVLTLQGCSQSLCLCPLIVIHLVCVEAEETHGDTNNKQTHFTHAKCDLFVVQDDEGHGGIWPTSRSCKPRDRKCNLHSLYNNKWSSGLESMETCFYYRSVTCRVTFSFKSYRFLIINDKIQHYCHCTMKWSLTSNQYYKTMCMWRHINNSGYTVCDYIMRRKCTCQSTLHTVICARLEPATGLYGLT